MLNRFLCTDIAEIRIFSRDEKKQDDMRHEYQAKYPDVAHKIKFYIGDGAIIGAGSIVTKSIPPRCLAVGNPARVIKEEVEWSD